MLPLRFSSRSASVSGIARCCPFGKIGDGVFELTAEVGVCLAASVPRPPSGVHSKLFQVSQAAFLWNAGDATRRQHCKLRIQVDRRSALRDELVVKESLLADFVILVDRDILPHIP